ncbi:MAG: alpha/beta fold hydrolase [Deltaproteobacteria bacterium]|nr:alpha/beta fold hydrolase [Deltaproteobacteria bacterium]
MSDDVAIILTPAQKRQRRIKKILLNLFFAAAAYGLLVVAARLLHRRVLYQPPDDAPGAVPQGTTLLEARAADGVAVHALVLQATKPTSSTRTIVHFHGNAETADANVALGRELEKKGFHVVLVEYRGYGRSKGAPPTEEGLYLDAAAVLDALGAKGVPAEKIVLWGQSLGTGVAVEMAKRGRGSRLVLVAPFTSTIDLARRVVPFLPAKMVMVDGFESLAKAPEIQAPAFVVHGDIDDVIPFEQGERLSKAFPHGTFLKVEEGRHDNLYKSTSVLQAAIAHAGG